MSFCICICMCSSSLSDTDTAELHSEVFCIQRYKRTAWRRRMAAASFDAVSESLQARATQVKRLKCTPQGQRPHIKPSEPCEPTLAATWSFCCVNSAEGRPALIKQSSDLVPGKYAFVIAYQQSLQDAGQQLIA